MPWDTKKYNEMQSRESVKQLRRTARVAPGIVREMFEEFLALDKANVWCGERFTILEDGISKLTDKQAKTALTRAFHAVGAVPLRKWIDSLDYIYGNQPGARR